MALAHDLLQQAEHLANLEGNRPKQASLRRATSSAYYALFHLLVKDAIGRLCPRNPPELGPRIGRSFVHGEMKQVCRSIMDGKPSQALAELARQGFASDLVFVARTFVLLQEARHSADYDNSRAWSRFDVIDELDRVTWAFDAWASIRHEDLAQDYLVSFLLKR